MNSRIIKLKANNNFFVFVLPIRFIPVITNRNYNYR